MTLSNGVLLRLLLAEVAALWLVTSVVFGHALWNRWRTSRNEPRVTRARSALVNMLTRDSRKGDTLDNELRSAFKRLPVHQQVNLFSDLASSLDGNQRALLTEFAIEFGLVERAENACRSRLWWRRLYGCRLLTLVGEGESIVPKLFHDQHPDVRAQAAEWAATHPKPEIVAALVNQLAAPTDLGRFSVQDSLLRLGSPANEPLTEYLATHQGTAVEAALEVAIGLADPRMLSAALTLCHDSEPRVRALATALIGALGGDDSLPILMNLLDDPADDVRAAAAEALGRLKYVSSAPALALKLRDRAWDVRLASGLALRNFGAPGILYLRRSIGDVDPYAADMAHQLLDISALVRDPV